MQASLALGGTLCALWRFAAHGGRGWLLGAALLGSVIPFTLLVIRPTTERLLEPSLDGGSPEAATLLARWGRLHAVRSAASAAAFVVFAVQLALG
jgi:hypothetical protein